VVDSSEEHAGVSTRDTVARRQFLLKAAVAGTAVWAVPSIIAIHPAAAAGLNSAPPKDVISRHVDPVPTQPQPQPAAVEQLPFTGDDNEHLLIAGAAATAAGASLLFLSHAHPRVALETAPTDDS
jgi:hypothetical protein